MIHSPRPHRRRRRAHPGWPALPVPDARWVPTRRTGGWPEPPAQALLTFFWDAAAAEGSVLSQVTHHPNCRVYVRRRPKIVSTFGSGPRADRCRTLQRTAGHVGDQRDCMRQWPRQQDRRHLRRRRALPCRPQWSGAGHPPTQEQREVTRWRTGDAAACLIAGLSTSPYTVQNAQ